MAFFTPSFGHLLVRYAGLVVLIGLVVILAVMQFGWLAQLSEEEQQRRRVALSVAAASYSEYVTRELSRLLEDVDAATSIDSIASGRDDLRPVFRIGENGPARLNFAGATSWSPAGTAELQQWLGRPLVETLIAGKQRPEAALWLSPPAIVRCRDMCEVALFPRAEIVSRVLQPGARRMFDEFGEDLQHAVVVSGVGREDFLYPPHGRGDDFSVTDLTRKLLDGIPVLGPDGSSWQLLVNHSGRSLEDAVARSHTRNLILSGGLLTLLLFTIVLLVFNARRLAALAREQLFFAAGVSHELRTPLAVISSAASNLADGVVDDEAGQRDHGILIQQHVQRLKRLIDNVLQFTQSAAFSRTQNPQDVDPARLVASAIRNCEPLLEQHRVEVDVAEKLPNIRGDETALESALGNLIANAARYGAGGDWLEIRAAAVRVRPRGQALRISVSNPVEGRPDPHPHRLFEPFYRGQNVRDAGIAGTGIGLSVARYVAKQHGGGLTVDTGRPGVITFHLLLPVDE